ncbi:MAG: putative glycoside hydrolase, partial [Acidimicrobiia bacterium]
MPLIVLGGIWLMVNGGGELSLAGIEDGAVLGADAAQPTITLTTDEPTDGLVVTLDGDPLPMTSGADGTLTATLSKLPDGDHTVEAVLTRSFPFGALEASRSFTLDTTPPALTILSPTEPVAVGDPVVVRAQVDDLEASVTVDGAPVTFDETGNFERSYPEVPDAAVVVAATDDLGNAVEQVVPIELALPGAPGAPPMMGVHATGWTWATPILKDPIMEMVDAGLINTIELDIKDEAGDIWYDTEVELAHDIGAVTVLFDLAAVVEELHEKGVRVVVRIVNFRDPRLANHAIETGNLDWVVQNTDGTPYGQYGGFTNPFNPEVREYNIALAEEAARLGADDILYDYVRRPDTLSELVYPGQEGSPEDAIVSFLAESLPRVNGAGARLGASVFGVAATRPTEIAQDIPRMAEVVDYVAPMTYPSHWGPGEYGVDNPNAQPYDITFRALEDFVAQTDGTRAHVVAWLQDFSLGIDYGPAEVKAQIQAAKDAGVENILLWDAATTYTPG